MIPLALSIAGSLAPPILSALFGAKTEQQARDAVQPQYSAMLMRLMSQEGMGRVEAERAADEAIRPEIEKAKSEGALPGWAEGLLSVAGGIGGWAAGAKLAGKAAAKAVAGVAKAAPRLGAPKLKVDPASTAKDVDFSVQGTPRLDAPNAAPRLGHTPPAPIPPEEAPEIISLGITPETQALAKSRRGAVNRNRGIFDELDEGASAAKAAQMEEMRAAMEAEKMASLDAFPKPYHERPRFRQVGEGAYSLE